MSETPRTGDRVRVILEGRFVEDDTGRCVELADRETVGIPDAASVEVLERADDPTIGEIRAVAPSADGTPKTAVKVGSRLSPYVGERFMWVIVETGEMLADGNVSGLGDVIGAVPDSPAAKAQPPARKQVRVPNEPHGLSAETRNTITHHLQGGNRLRAVLTAANAGLGRDGAETYIRDMEEYQAHGEKREPRVFPIDGPEPPPDVTTLRDDHTDHDDMGYLLRAEDGWCWSPSPKLVPPDCGRIQSWKDAASSADGNLWEVLS